MTASSVGRSLILSGCATINNNSVFRIMANLTNTIAVGSDGQSLPQTTINVNTTNGFPTSGTLLVVTSGGTQTVTYTGTTSTTFTGCSGGTGTMNTGNLVTSTNGVRIFSTNGNTDGNNGRILWKEMDSSAYVEGQNGSVANITTVTGGRVVTVTGLTGMTPLSTNRYLTITGASSSANNGTFKILSFISSSSVTIINSAGVASDANNGSIAWKEMDPLLENYLLLQQSSWLCMQGPSTLKIPITSASTGTFLKGENITQTTSGAQAEIIGYVFDAVAAAGYLVAMPRVHGTGGGALGWDTNLITGDISGATVTPSANPLEFTREVVFWASQSTNTANAMNMWMQVVDGYTTGSENSSRFSVLANSAGCSSGLPPGAGGDTTIAAGSNGQSLPQATINIASNFSFPTGGTAFVVTSAGVQTVTYTGTTATTLTGCSGGTGTMSTGGAVVSFPIPGTQTVMGNAIPNYAANTWGCVSIANIVYGYSHFMCADTTYDTGRSADGSFCGAVGVPNNISLTANSNGTYHGCLWTRVDAQEDGDVDPYVFYLPTGTTNRYTGASRTLSSGNGFGTNASTEHFTASTALIPGGTPIWGNDNQTVRAWRRRGFAVGDGYQNCGLFTIGHTNAGNNFSSSATGTLNQYNDPLSVMARNIAVVGDPIWVISTQNLGKVRKGIMRWARLVNVGTATDLYQGGLYIQLSNSLPAMIVGPWDKKTIPIR
jgi:hypothetical protein